MLCPLCSNLLLESDRFCPHCSWVVPTPRLATPATWWFEEGNKEFKVKDAAGIVHTFQSLAEMPPEIRKIVKTLQRKLDPPSTGSLPLEN